MRSQVMGQAPLVPSVDHTDPYTWKVGKTRMKPFTPQWEVKEGWEFSGVQLKSVLT